MTARQFVFLTTMMSAALLVVGQLYVAIPLLPGLAARFGTDLKGAALVGTAFGLAYATGFLVFGLLSDRIGRVRVILFGLLALAAATVLAALAETFSLLLAARALQGLAAATFPPAALSLVVESLPAERRPFGIAAMSFAFLGAAPATQVLGAALAERGFAPILSGAAILYFVAAAALWGLVRRDAVPRSGGAVPPGGRFDLLRDGTILACWLAAATVLLAFVSFQAGTLLLADTLPVGLAALRFLTLPPLLATFLAAPLIRRFGPAATARGGLGLIAAGLAGAATTSAPGMTVGAVLLTAGVAITVPGLIGAVSARAAPANRGLALAVYSFALFLGASLAPLLAAWLAPLGFTALFGPPAALALLAAGGLTLAARPATRPGAIAL